MGNDFTTFEPGEGACGPTTGEIAIRTSIASHSLPTNDPLTERSLRVWSAGDYDRIAAGFRHEAESFIDRLQLNPILRVLDLACGSGNLTIPAARTGAHVTGLDIVPSLLEAAAEWSARESLSIRLDQGSVEKLPYVDASFDVVTSMFGTMFAARPELVVSELERVTRPGGRVALANWTRGGFIGKLLATHVAYVTPPAGVPSTLLWGDESVVRERFDERVWDVKTRTRMLTFRYPYTPAGTSDLFRTSYGPTIRTMEALERKEREQLTADLLFLWERNQRAGAKGTEVDSEYLEVIAIRR